MKKIFIIFLTLILFIVLSFSCFATAGSNQYGINLLNESNKTIIDVQTEYNGSFTRCNLYDVSISDDTQYTLISSEQLNGMFVSPKVNGDVLTYSSVNKFNPYIMPDSQYGISNFSVDQGIITCQVTGSDPRWVLEPNTLDLPTGEYYALIDVSTNDPSGDVPYIKITQNYLDSSHTRRIIYDGSNFDYWDNAQWVIEIENYTRSYDYEISISISLIPMDEFIPFYDFIYNTNSNQFLYHFTTTDLLDYEYYLGFYNENNIPTGVVDSTLYLVEGYISSEDLIIADEELAYQNGYNDGYEIGYNKGEMDNMTATSFLKNIILTIFNVPFTLMSYLNFDFFGINVYRIFQVAITIMLVAFVITKLKGRE